MPDHDPSRADGAAELMRNEVGEVLVGVDGDACGFLDLAHVGMVVDEVGHALAAAGGGRHLLPAVGAGEPVPSTTCFEITTSSTPSRLGSSNMVSSRMLSMIERRPRAPRLALDRLPGDCPKRFLGQRQIDLLHLKQPLVLFDKRILRFNQNAPERRLVEIFEGWRGPAGAQRIPGSSPYVGCLDWKT